jgi:GntR family transcriptional regulator
MSAPRADRGTVVQSALSQRRLMANIGSDGIRKLRYQKVEDYLRSKLVAAEYTSGDRIPSERDLADILQVNRLTVRRAVGNLVVEGLLENNGTGGTRVAAPSFVRPADIYRSVGIDRLIQGHGKVPSNKLLHFQISSANNPLADRLGVMEGEEIVIIRRLWSIDNRPFCIETSHLPANLVPGLAAEDLMLGQSLYLLMKERYGITTVNSDRIISVETASDLESKALDMPANSAALTLRLWVKTDDGRTVEYMRSVNNPKIVAFGTSSAQNGWMTGRL